MKIITQTPALTVIEYQTPYSYASNPTGKEPRMNTFYPDSSAETTTSLDPLRDMQVKLANEQAKQHYAGAIGGVKAGITDSVSVANLTRVEDMVMRVAQAAEGLSGVVGGFIYGPRPESGPELTWPPLEDRFERLVGMLDATLQTIARCTVAIGQRG